MTSTESDTTSESYRDHGHIVVIDDEAQIRRFLRISLTSQGYTVAEAATGNAGLDLIATQNPALVVLDLGLPDIDGKSVLTELRQWSRVPVIILSVRQSEAEKVIALDAGANDYVTKPFGIQEFLARVRNLLRQSRPEERAPVVRSGNVSVDLVHRIVELGGERVRLTPKEFAVLQLLATHPNRVITQTQLLRDIWGVVHEHDTHYLRVVIGRLRQKLGDDPNDPHLLETESGVGYRFRTDEC